MQYITPCIALVQELTDTLVHPCCSYLYMGAEMLSRTVLIAPTEVIVFAIHIVTRAHSQV